MVELISNEINNVFRYYRHYNLIIGSNNEVKNFKKEILFGFQKPIDYLKFGQRIYIEDNNSQLCQIIGGKSILITPDNSIKFSKIEFKFILLSNQKTRTESLFSLETNEIIYSDDFLGNLIYDNFLITCIAYKPEIVIKNLQDNTLISSFPLSKLGTYNHGAEEQPYKVALFAGMYQNTLVCTVQWGGVLLLDVQTGEAIKFFKEAPAVYYLYPSAEDSPVYWSLEYTKFAEIDVAKAEILRDIELRPQLDAMAIQYGIQAGMLDIVTSVCYDGIIYFIAGGYFLGVFDPVSATIINHHYFKFHKNGHRLRSGKEFLQVQGKEIYILDTEGTLHMMVRE
jgi:hypothetical protein